MAVTSGFFNSKNGDRRYSAEEMSAIFDGVINDGVFANIGTAFKVTADGTTNIAKVGIGRCWFNSTWLLNDAILPLIMPDSDVLYDRIDAIVIEINHSDYVRAGSIKVIKGKAAQSPQKPTLINVESLNQYAIAYVRVPAGSTTIGQQDITNNVGTSTCPYVTGILQVQNIDNIVAQWEAQWKVWYSQTEDWEQAIDTDRQEWSKEWADWYANETSDTTETMEAFLLASKAQIDKWFEDLRTNLDSQSTAVALASKIADLQYKFDTLASERAIYDTIEDSSGNPLIGSDGTEIIGKTVFEAGDGSVGEVVVENRQYTAKLLASGWEGDASSGYSQTVACAGMTANKIVLPPMFVPTGDKATDVNTQIALGYIGMVQTLDEQIQVVCYSKKPSVDLDIVLLEGAGGDTGGAQDVVIGPNTDTFFEDDSLLSSFGGKVTSVPKATITEEVKRFVKENYAEAVTATTSLSKSHTIHPDYGSKMSFIASAVSEANLKIVLSGETEEELDISIHSPLLFGDRFESKTQSGCDTLMVFDGSSDEDWMKNGDKEIYSVAINDSFEDGVNYPAYCDRYSGSQFSGNLTTELPNKSMQYQASTGYIYFRDDDGDFLNRLKTNPIRVWLRSTTYTESKDIEVSLEKHSDSVYADDPIVVVAKPNQNGVLSVSSNCSIAFTYHSIEGYVEQKEADANKRNNAKYARALKGVADKATSLTIYPDEASPVSITVHGATTQEGSGDPSPENVMPLSGVGRKMATVVLDGVNVKVVHNVSWTDINTHDMAFFYVQASSMPAPAKQMTLAISDAFPIGKFTYTSEKEGLTILDVLYIAIKKSKLNEVTSAGMNEWLKENPVTVHYVPEDESKATEIYTWSATDGDTYEAVVNKLNAPLYEGDSMTNDELSGCDMKLVFDDKMRIGVQSINSEGLVNIQHTPFVELVGGTAISDALPYNGKAIASAKIEGVHNNDVAVYIRLKESTLEPYGHIQGNTETALIAAKAFFKEHPLTVFVRSVSYNKKNDIRTTIETHKCIEYVFDGSADEVWTNNPSWTNAGELFCAYYKDGEHPKVTSKGTTHCDRLAQATKASNIPNIEGYWVENTAVYVCVNKSRLDEQSINGMKRWLQQNPVHFVIPLITPIAYAHPVQEVLASPKDDGTITITTEENAMVSANYNKSITRAFEELQALVISLGGIADV